MLTYGSEMGDDELSAYTLDPRNAETIYSIKKGTRLIYEYRGSDNSDSTPDDMKVPPANNEPNSNLLGTWTAGNGKTWIFTSAGGLTISGGGETEEYSYLIRKDRLVTLSHDGTYTIAEYAISGGSQKTLTPVKNSGAAVELAAVQ
jgi:hypothetical protein